jgi:hypothetical protein
VNDEGCSWCWLATNVLMRQLPERSGRDSTGEEQRPRGYHEKIVRSHASARFDLVYLHS